MIGGVKVELTELAQPAPAQVVECSARQIVEFGRLHIDRLDALYAARKELDYAEPRDRAGVGSLSRAAGLSFARLLKRLLGSCPYRNAFSIPFCRKSSSEPISRIVEMKHGR